MGIRVGSVAERIRASLFFIPMASVVGAVVLAQVTLGLDNRLAGAAGDVPLVLRSTVESARAVLSTVAAATITVAGIAFSVSLLVIQLGSAQFSPRVVHTLFRDPFNKRVMGVVVGTFTYCLVVLRAVRAPVDAGGDPVVPNLSVSLSLVLGIATILAIVAFISHSAHSMDISKILDRVTREALASIREEWRMDGPDAQAPPSRPPPPQGHEVRFGRSGWVQQVDTDTLLRCPPEGSTIFLHTHPGRYAVAGARACTVSPEPPPTRVDELERSILGALGVGATRTMQQDVSYGLRQLADVALKALSPGINDPTTAQDAIFHAAAVLLELLHRRPPDAVRTGPGGRTVVLLHQPTHEELVGLAFDEVRRAAAAQPQVCIYLLQAIQLVLDALGDGGGAGTGHALREQARLVLAGARGAGLLADDLARVETAHGRHFATG